MELRWPDNGKCWFEASAAFNGISPFGETNEHSSDANNQPQDMSVIEVANSTCVNITENVQAVDGKVTIEQYP